MPAPPPTPPLNTDSGLGQGPGLIVLSPAGFVVRYNVVGWSPTGTGQNVPGVVSPVTGGISTGGTGDISLAGYHVSGRQNTLDATFTTGVAGTAQLVAALVDTIPTPTGYAGIFLDTQNRPFVVVTDVAGVVVGQTAPTGPAVLSGTPIHALIEWNASGAINGSDFVILEVGETAIENWSVEPETAWTPFQPGWLMVGDGFGSYGPLKGAIGNVTLGNGGTPAFIPPQESQSLSIAVGMGGNSTLSATAQIKRAFGTAIAGQATVAGDVVVA